jgi:hypothetical protein
MGILVEMIDPRSVKAGRSTLYAMNLVVFLEQEFRQVGSILAGYTGDKGYFRDSIAPVIKKFFTATAVRFKFLP